MSAPTHELATVRDWLRYAVSRFTAAGLVFGHGSENAYDEAAYLILHTLHLPIDTLEPFMDARLLPEEVAAVLKVIERRAVDRVPAAYITHEAFMHGMRFYVDERVIVPRSYIGEMMAKGLLSDLEVDFQAAESVLDLCTGSGCLAILAASQFPNAEIHAADLSKDALEVAKINVKEHGLTDRITLHQGDLFKPLGKQKFDFIISNPPYVAKAEVDAFPPEYQAEPVMAHLGGDDGFDLVRKLITEAPKHLNAGGGLLCEVGTGGEILEAEFPGLNFFWLDSEESEGEVFFLRF